MPTDQPPEPTASHIPDRHATPTAGETFPTPAHLRPGIAPDAVGRYVVLGVLGSGAFGTVYRALDPQLDRDIAVKVPHPGALDSPSRIERFLREAKAAARLRHPHLVPVFDAGIADGIYYIAAAFIDGKPLSTLIPDDGFDPRRAAGVAFHLADAVGYAHAHGIVHRDIKPANVLLDAADRPHLTDFGLAAQADESARLTTDGSVLGTPAYMAPEQAGGRADPDPRSDQYSLGVLLYELLTGRTPFIGGATAVLAKLRAEDPPPVRELRPELPRDLETICMKAMARQPADRYRDCAALADDLRRFLAGEPIRARRQSVAERLVRWAKRHTVEAAAVAATAAALVVGAGVSFALMLRAQDAERTADSRAREATDARRTAEENLTKAEAEEARAEQAAADLKQTNARVYRDRGFDWCSRGGQERGQLLLTEALDRTTDPADADVLRRGLTGWGRGVPHLTYIFDHTRPVFAVAFRPGADELLAGDDSGAVVVRNVATGAETARHPGPSGVRSIGVTADGNTAVVRGVAGEVRVIDLTGRSETRTLPGPYTAVAVAPVGDRVATAVDEEIEVWSVAAGPTGKATVTVPYPVRVLAFHPTDPMLAVGTNVDVRLADLAVPKKPARLLASYQDTLSLTFYADGKSLLFGTDRFFTGGNDGNGGFAALRVNVSGTPTARAISYFDSWVFAAATHPTADLIATGSRDGTAHVRHINGQASGYISSNVGHPAAVRGVAFHPTEPLVATACEDGGVRLWAVRRQPGRPLPGYGTPIGVIPNGRIVTVVNHRQLVTRDLASGQAVGTPITLPDVTDDRSNDRAAVAADGRRAAVVGRDRLVRQWELATGRPVGVPVQLPPDLAVMCIGYSPDSRRLAVGYGLMKRNDRSGVGVFDPDTGRRLHTVPHTEWPLNLAFSPDGRYLLTASEDQTARLTDLSTAPPTDRLLQMRNAAWGAAFRPDGGRLLVSDWNGTGAFFDPATGRPVGPKLRVGQIGNMVAKWSPTDPRLVVLAGYFNGVQAFDAGTGHPLTPPAPTVQQTQFLVFAPDGGRVLYADGSTGHASEWPVPTPAVGSVAQIRKRIQLAYGQELNEADSLGHISPARWHELRAELEAAGGPAIRTPLDLLTIDPFAGK